MENKKSFVLYADLIHTVKQLPPETAGLLFKHLLSYVNDENPTTDDIVVSIAFEPIKQQLKRDLVKWGETREGRSKAGKASAEARKQKKLTNSTNVKSVQQKLTNPTVNDNVTVNVSVNENATLIKKEFFNSDSWFDDIARINKTTTKVIKPFAVQFITESYSGDFEEPLKEVKRHFANWIKKQDLQDSTDSPKVLTSYQQQQDHIAKINKAQEARG